MCLKKNVVEYGQKLCLGCLWLCDFAADFTTTAHEAQKDKCCVTWFLAIYLYQTSMEDDLNGAQPQWKTTSIEADLNRRWPPYKITLMEDNLNGRWPQWKANLMKDDLNKMTWMEDDPNGRWPQYILMYNMTRFQCLIDTYLL